MVSLTKGNLDYADPSRYPMHSKPKNNQAFIYMNLAISIAVDLGLDQDYPSMNVFSAISTKGLIENALFTREAKRAYLGCYYLSSAYVTGHRKLRSSANFPSLSMGFQKPNNLHYRNLMDERGEALLQNESHGDFNSSDIISLVKLQHLTERIGQVHMSKQPEMSEYQDSSLVAEMNIQLFLNELDEWRTNTSDEIKNLRRLLFDLHRGVFTDLSYSFRWTCRSLHKHHHLQPRTWISPPSLPRSPQIRR